MGHRRAGRLRRGGRRRRGRPRRTRLRPVRARRGPDRRRGDRDHRRSRRALSAPGPRTRVAVVDLGTNSTRLLIADVSADGSIAERDRRSIVTRLGQGVDATGALAPDAIDRVVAVLREYRRAIDEHGAERTVAVLTSAVRDAADGAVFARRVRDEFGLDARTIPGEEEARLPSRGATSGRPAGAPAPVVVIDIGGGSTEYVVGDRHGVAFHVSTQSGAVRQTERHLHSDPPAAG